MKDKTFEPKNMNEAATMDEVKAAMSEVKVLNFRISDKLINFQTSLYREGYFHLDSNEELVMSLDEKGLLKAKVQPKST